MSFGRHEYQHRFFKPTPHKKVALYTPQSSNYVLPPLSHELIALPQTHIVNESQHLPPINNTSFVNNPYLSASKSRMKYDDPTVQAYQTNAAVLDYFKREAEQNRKRKRLNHLKIYQNTNHYGTIKTEGSEPYAYQSLQPVSIVYNPQVIHQINSLKEQNRELTLSRLEREKIQSNVQLRSYKNKYHKLKKKLNEELQEKIRVQKMQRIARQQLAADKQKDQLKEIKEMMNNISDNLRKNSHILEQSIKTREDLSLQMSKSAVKSNPPEKRLSISQFLDEDIDDYPSSPPSVVYTKKSLDAQYHKMEKLKNEINLLNSRLKTFKD